MEHANTDTVDVGVTDDPPTSDQLLARARAEGNPWANMAGIFKDAPLFDESVEIMREKCRKDDEGKVMQIPVLIEPLSADRFRATGGVPLSLSAEGATRGEALAHLSRLVRESLTAGAELVTLDVPAPDPWHRFAGGLRDNPLYDDWVEAMREFREKMNEALPGE